MSIIIFLGVVSLCATVLAFACLWASGEADEQQERMFENWKKERGL